MITEETLPVNKSPQDRALELSLEDGAWWSIYKVDSYDFYYQQGDD